jgi:hypothetical protein
MNFTEQDQQQSNLYTVKLDRPNQACILERSDVADQIKAAS